MKLLSLIERLEHMPHIVGIALVSFILTHDCVPPLACGMFDTSACLFIEALPDCTVLRMGP
jgi:hypothetical protein